MITLLLISLAAIFKAVADTLQHHFDTSVFAKLNPKFWNPVISCNYAKFLPFTKYRLDGWHLANSGMIVFFILAVVFASPVKLWWLAIIICGVVFNLVFNLFYNQILR